MLYQPTAHDVMLYRSISSGESLFDYIYIYIRYCGHILTMLDLFVDWRLPRV